MGERACLRCEGRAMLGNVTDNTTATQKRATMTDHDGYTAHHYVDGHHDPDTCVEMWETLDELGADEPTYPALSQSGSGLWGVWHHTGQYWLDQGYDFHDEARTRVRQLGGDPDAGPIRVAVECHEHPGERRDICSQPGDPRSVEHELA